MVVDVADASRAGREDALVVLELERGLLQVSGPDRKTWLNGIVSCDVTKVSDVRGAYGLLLNKQGKIQTDVELVEADQVLYLSCAPGRASWVASTLDRMLVMEDAELSEVTDDLVCLRVHGSLAAKAAEALSTLPRASGAIDWTGLGGQLVILERGRVEEALAMLAPLSFVMLATDEAWLALRTERLFPVYGRDYDEHDNPHEASLDQRAVSFDKGCYLGQEVVCMQDMRGRVKRRLVGLEFEPGTPPAPGAEVLKDGEVVGELKSVSPGPPARALARIKAAAGVAGAQVHVADHVARVFDVPI